MASQTQVAVKPVNTEFISRSFTSLTVLNATKGLLWGGLFGVSQSFGEHLRVTFIDVCRVAIYLHHPR